MWCYGKEVEISYISQATKLNYESNFTIKAQAVQQGLRQILQLVYISLNMVGVQNYEPTT